jgi:hypothetical protein
MLLSYLTQKHNRNESQLLDHDLVKGSITKEKELVDCEYVTFAFTTIKPFGRGNEA